MLVGPIEGDEYTAHGAVNRLDGTLDRAFDSPEAKRRYNARLFTTIAGRYDFITRLLSYGRDQAAERDLLARAAIAPGLRVLDLATGTGDLALAAAAQGAAVVGLDLAPRMLRLARAKPSAGAVRFLVGDMTSLPLPPASVDVVTTGYGLRNVPDLDRAIAEIARVLRQAAASCRSTSRSRRTRLAARLLRVSQRRRRDGGHAPARRRGHAATYPRRWRGIRAPAAASRLRAAGFASADVLPKMAGFMAIHVARR